jgi:hypothetical protein
MVSKTRKSKASKSVNSIKSLSVPELRRAFEHIDRFVSTKVMRLSEKEGVTAFRKEWKKTFGQISEKAAKDYLHYMKSTSSHKQKGGAVTVLSPAAIGYDMRAGEGELSIPPYVGGGLAPPADSQNGPSRGAEYPSPAVGTGSNAVMPQKGGKRTRKTRKQGGGALPSFGTALAEFVSRPFGMGAPPTPAQDAQMLMKGYNQFSSPRPEINDLNLGQGRTIFNATISPTSRLF